MNDPELGSKIREIYANNRGYPAGAFLASILADPIASQKFKPELGHDDYFHVYFQDPWD